jgi:hypothetical protein
MSTPERAQDRGAHGYGSAGQDIDAVDHPEDDAEECERAKEDADEVREYLRGERDVERRGEGDDEPTGR